MPWANSSCCVISMPTVSLCDVPVDTRNKWNSSWSVASFPFVLTSRRMRITADGMENFRWYKHSSLSLFCSSGLFYGSFAHDVSSNLLPLRSLCLIANSICGSFHAPPPIQLPGQEPHQAGLAATYCCVGFCLPSLAVCAPPAPLRHHHPTVHLPHSLETQSFSRARKGSNWVEQNDVED